MKLRKFFYKNEIQQWTTKIKNVSEIIKLMFKLEFSSHTRKSTSKITEHRVEARE